MYDTVIDMTRSKGLKERLTGCAALEGRADAPMWVEANIFRIVSDPSWVEAYQYAQDTKTRNVNQDTGDRDDVINDNMILSRIQAIITEDTPPVEEPAGP